MFLVIIHHLVDFLKLYCFFQKTQRFRDWILSPSSGKPSQLGPIDRASPYLRTLKVCDNGILLQVQVQR
jgi:hypothetical protein